MNLEKLKNNHPRPTQNPYFRFMSRWRPFTPVTVLLYGQPLHKSCDNMKREAPRSNEIRASERNSWNLRLEPLQIRHLQSKIKQFENPTSHDKTVLVKCSKSTKQPDLTLRPKLTGSIWNILELMHQLVRICGSREIEQITTRGRPRTPIFDSCHDEGRSPR